MKIQKAIGGFTVTEVMIASTLTGFVLAAMALGSIALQKNMAGNQHYSASANNGARMVDYMSRDIRNAIRVTRITGTTRTAFKSGLLTVTTDESIAISVPDYYLSNVPDNSAASAYKTSRYSRNNLTGGATYYNYDQAVEVVGVTRVPRYASELEIRYTRRARSTSDPTVCYFRSEYDGGGTLRSEEEVAEKVDSEQLSILAIEPNRFRISTSFASKWTGELFRACTRQFSSVKIINKRRD